MRARMMHDSFLTAVAALPMGWATCELHCMGAASSWRRQRIASAAAIVAAIATSSPRLAALPIRIVNPAVCSDGQLRSVPTRRHVEGDACT